jgi:hypothetical protein
MINPTSGLKLVRLEIVRITLSVNVSYCLMQVLHLKTYTWLEPGEYHAVLLCNTSKGWFVLDNRYNWPMTPKSLPYRWDKALDEVDGKWYEFSVS